MLLWELLEPDVPIVCFNWVSVPRFSVAADVTPYSGVDELEALTPRLVAEPTWKLLLVPRELLNCAVPLPLKLNVPGDEAEMVNWFDVAWARTLVPRPIAAKLDKSAAERSFFLMGCTHL